MVTWGETEVASMVTLPQPRRVCYVVMTPLVTEPALVMEHVAFHRIPVTRPWFMEHVVFHRIPVTRFYVL